MTASDQKQLRLQKTRCLILGEDIDATVASHSVGYESPSQFCREYSRLFGAPPTARHRAAKNGIESVNTRNKELHNERQHKQVASTRLGGSAR